MVIITHLKLLTFFILSVTSTCFMGSNGFYLYRIHRHSPHAFYDSKIFIFLKKNWVSVPEYLNISNVLILTNIHSCILSAEICTYHNPCKKAVQARRKFCMEEEWCLHKKWDYYLRSHTHESFCPMRVYDLYL